MKALLSPRLPRFALALCLFSVVPAIVAQAQVSVKFEALSNQQPPGTPVGFTWNDFKSAAIADDGETTFTASLRDAGTFTQGAGLWRGSGGQYTLVVRHGDNAPNAGGTFNSLFVAHRGPAPDKPLSFFATVDTGTGNSNSIWSVVNGVLTKVAFVGNDEPGGTTYQDLYGDIHFASKTNAMAFGGTSGVADPFFKASLWYVNGSTVELAARTGDPAPGFGQYFIPSTLANHALSGDGFFVFFSQISNAPIVDGLDQNQAFFKGKDSTYQPIVRNREHVSTIPGALFADFFGEGFTFDVNASGNVVFFSVLGSQPGQNVITSANDRGLFIDKTKIVQKGDLVPDGAAGERFTTFPTALINRQSNLAYEALTFDGFTSRDSIFIFGDEPRRVVTTGDPAPGTEDGTLFSSINTSSELQFNNKGQVFFAAILTNPDPDIVDSTNNFGLWGTDPDGNLLLVARTGDQIEVAPGDKRTIIDFERLAAGIPAGPDDGRPKALNDSGQVVFCVRLSGSMSGIVRANLGSGGGSTSANFKESAESGDPVNTRIGELLASAVDLKLRGPMPLSFARYYAARLASDGSITSALGPNWLSNFDTTLAVSGNTAQAVTNEGRVMSFTKTNSVWKLTAPLDTPFQLVQNGTDFILADPRSQRMRIFDLSGKLTKIEDGRGNAHTLHYDDLANPTRLTSVGDGLGRTLSLTYDASGKLMSIGDGTRTVQYAYNANGNLASVTDPLNHTTSYTYSAGALLSSTMLPRGNTPITQTFAGTKVASQIEHPESGDQTAGFAYDTSARTTTITDATSQTRIHGYTATGELGSFTDEEGGGIALGADATGRRGTVTDQLGRKTSITYDTASGKPASITNAEGATATFTYKARVLSGVTFYDLEKVVRADGSVRTFTYDANGNRLTATDPLGKQTTFTYNGRGQLSTRTNPTGGVAFFTYDETSPVKGTLKTSKDSDTAETTYTHDAFSRLTKLTHPDGRHIDIEYDAADNIIAITDERGKKFAFTYNANDNVTVVTDPAGQTTQLGYDAIDRVTQVTDRLGRMSSRTFDSRDLLASETDALNHTTTLAHDTRQRLTGVTEPGSATVSFGYDEVGRPVSITDPLAHTSTTVRNNLGRAIAATDALGHTVQLERDKQQRITKVIDPLGRQAALTYDQRGLLAAAARDGVGASAYARDAAGRLVEMTDPNHSTWTYAYTPAGRLKSGKDPLGQTTALSYDPMTGRLASAALPDGVSCAFERDESGRITRANFSGAIGPDLHYGYDALGRLISANGVTLTRDAEGQITNSAQVGVDFSASYDAAGRLATVGYAGTLTVTYTYDLNDRLIGVTDSLSLASVALTYDAAGRLTSVTRSNGVNTTLTYDAADRLTRIQDGTILDLQYTLDAAGNITMANFVNVPLLPGVAASAKQFQYDDASQVKSTGFTYDARGRLTAMPDAAGGADHTFMWDGASRLVRLDATALGYDGFGDVATRTTGSATTRLFYHHAIALHPLVAERDESDTTFTRFYVWTPGGTLLYAVDAATHAPSFYHSDRVGSTLARTDAAGAVTDKYAYSPYGEVLGREGTSTQPFTFAGGAGIRAEGPLYQMRARYYDPLTARFLSRDPGGPRLGDPRTLDPYLYALGNPARYIDADGALPTNPNGAYEIGEAKKFHAGLFGLSLNESDHDLFYEPLAPGTLLSGYACTRPLFAEIQDTSVVQPTLPTREIFNTELNDSLERARRVEEEYEYAASKQSSPAAAAVLEDAPVDDALIDAEVAAAEGGKADGMVEDAIEETGDGDPAVADAIPVGMNRGGNRGNVEPSGPLQIFLAAKNQLLIQKFGSLKAAKKAAKHAAREARKKKQNAENKKNIDSEKNKYQADPYTTDPKDVLDLGEPKK